MKLKNHIDVLAEIEKEFNKHDVTWALGGSLLLYFEELTDSVDDIDIFVKTGDVKKAIGILDQMGKKLKPRSSSQFGTKYYFPYLVQGIKIDLMADFIIIKDFREYRFPLKKESIARKITIKDTDIYLQKLSDWEQYYALMGREKRVAEITKKKRSN